MIKKLSRAWSVLMLGVTVALAQFGSSVPTGGKATMALDRATVIAAINATDFEARDKVLDLIEARVKNAAEAAATFDRPAESVTAEAQRALKDAARTASEKEIAVKQSVSQARKVRADGWTEARNAVAASYDAYAEALAKVEASATAHPGASNSGAPK